VDVGFIFVDSDFVGPKVPQQMLKLGQSPSLLPSGESTLNGRLGASSACSDALKHSGHVRLTRTPVLSWATRMSSSRVQVGRG
jgi:hypothetical protein